MYFVKNVTWRPTPQGTYVFGVETANGNYFEVEVSEPTYDPSKLDLMAMLLDLLAAVNNTKYTGVRLAARPRR